MLVTCLGLAAPNDAVKDLKKTVTQSSNELSIESLDAKIKALADKQDLNTATKSKLQARYVATKENLENLALFKSQTAQYQDALQTTPLKIKNLQTEITRTEARIKEQQNENVQTIPTDELEERYILEKGKLSTLDDEIKQLENAILVQNSRPQLMRTETVTINQALEAAQQKLATLIPNAESKLETEANQLQLKTLIDARASELKLTEFESISHPIRIQLLNENLKSLSLKRTLLEPIINAIEEQLAIRRQLEANKVNEELSLAEKEIADQPLVIQTITRENIQYSRDLQTLTLKQEQYSTQKTTTDQQTSAIQQDLKSAEKKISLAGLSPALGKILREQRRNLSFKDEFYLQSEAIQNETAITSLEQFKVEDRLKQLGDIDQVLNRQITEQVDATLPSNQRLRIKAELRVLLNTQKDLLNKLSGLYINYIRSLGDVDFARQQLLIQANQYAAYLDKRLLWVHSSLPLNADYPLQIYESSKWLLAPSHWLTLTKDTLTTFINHPFLGLIALISLIALQVYKSKIKIKMVDINSKVSRPTTDHFNYTLKSLGYSLILVAPLALFLNYLGWFLSQDMQLASFTKAVGTGLRAAALPLFFLQFYHHLFHPEGIARKHFSWRKNPIAVIRQQLALLTYSVVPATFFIAMTGAYENVIHTDTLGRLALIISLLSLAYALGKLLHPTAELFPKRIRNDPQHWLTKFQFIWYPMVISLPLIVIGFAVSGYYLSALDLQQKLIITLRVFFTTVIVYELVIRWLSLVNRQLSLRNARQIETTLDEQAETGARPTAQGGLPEELIDIPAVNAQTIQILNVVISISLLIATWMVWKNILPAFAFLDQVVLWQHRVVIDAQEAYQPVTLTNLIFAGVYSFIAFMTVSNLSGLMELMVFRRFETEPGSRYAVNQLGKYLILTIAFITIANELGGSWSQVQWLAAALSVGLGFGLQEIFANLVSGIILLFERPIRVGDTVTVGDITGTVNRIQMRATTLIDGDQKELIVPNKTFITSQLVNWTLTDPTTRVVIPVGIAYGSDITLAHKIMLDTLKNMPQVLESPEPSALFIGFGDSALNFSIRLFVGKLSERLLVTHELHLRLEQAFRDNNIVIPFPQRDVHIHPRQPPVS
ncbi:MAG: mechanosensitive ion channel [Methylococcaceae bacterium]|nr:mechanosensitive ion channel [Methylococcaceae bacterium]